MNKARRQSLAIAEDLLARAKEVVEQARDEEQDALDAMPENLEYSDRAAAMEEAARTV